MSDSSDPSRRARVILTLVVFAAGLAIDLWSKAYAWNNLRYPGQPLMVIDPVFELAYSFNTGSAFGIMTGVSWARAFFIAVTLLALAYMVWLTMRLPTNRGLSFVAIGLVAAGASGNLHDRLVRADALGRHGVVDFLKINYPWGGSWPTFNVADVLLLVGVGLLFLFLPRDDGEEQEQEQAQEQAQAQAQEQAQAREQAQAQAREQARESGGDSAGASAD